MSRSLTIALALFTSVAAAQPAERAPAPTSGPPSAPNPRRAAPRKRPAATLAPVERPVGSPLDPYAEPAPGDPYAPPPATTGPSSAMPSAETPVDPYAAPARPSATAAALPVSPPGAAPRGAPAAAPAIPERVSLSDLAAVQGLLAVQRLDGWLLFDRAGENPIAAQLVGPRGRPSRPWFYLMPARGEPVVLVHAAEQQSLAHLPGKRLTYQGYRDLGKQLRAMLKRVRTVAVEHATKAAAPGAARVDAGTIELIRGAGVKVRTSDTLVQFTKAIWGAAGRVAHHVAAHHLVELRKDALAFVADAVQKGQPITDHDVQQRIVRGMTMRGLVGTPPAVAVGASTADPYHLPDAAAPTPIKRGDLLVIALAAKLDQADGVWAAQTWVAVVDAAVPADVAKTFETVRLARDHALAFITDRVRKRRVVRGGEVDDAVRAFLRKAGAADKVRHRTGHSLDTDLQGSGADLDNFEVEDSRILTPGTGFTVGPGLYAPGAFGVRSEVSVYLAPSGIELTTPAQAVVEAVLAR